MELLSRTMALIMLIILSPLFLLISIISFIFQRSPIIYKQERIGFNYNSFMCYKFRSMIINNSDNKITDSIDSRITKWGKFLRALKLDELPQLWNIIKGDMRFIGPRPEVREFADGNDFSFLKKIKPGLTDFSSILLRNESEILNRAGGVENYTHLLKLKIALGHLYAEHKSFWLDLKLVLLTLVSIVLSKTAIKLVKKHFIGKYDPELIPTLDKWV